VAYHTLGASWILFAALILVPDLGLLGYLAGPRVGALAYNSVHTYLAPGLLALLAYLQLIDNAWPVCLIWMAHIGMDRSLGLGLKFTSAFQNTHLGVVGRAAS
jgi:hypothetical protein